MSSFECFFLIFLFFIVIGEIAYIIFMFKVWSRYPDIFRKFRWFAFAPLMWAFAIFQIPTKERLKIDLATKRLGWLNLMLRIFAATVWLVFLLVY